MKIVIFSRTPLAAAPWELWKALRKYTDVDATLINELHRYADGRGFPHQLLLSSDNGMAAKALRDAELWHVHNYWTHRAAALHDGQPIVAQFHSLPRLGDWQKLMRVAHRRYTIDQPLHVKEYGLPALPNIIDPDEYYPGVRGRKVRIAFAPTTRVPVGPPHSKGYHAVLETLFAVASKRDVDIDLIEGVDYEENLARKRQCHILIDDVVTGNWHRTSLEGACFGCAVLNRVEKAPFVHATLGTLAERLFWLIDNPATLDDIQCRTRLWVLQEWHAMDLVQRYVDAYKEALA